MEPTTWVPMADFLAAIQQQEYVDPHQQIATGQCSKQWTRIETLRCF